MMKIRFLIGGLIASLMSGGLVYSDIVIKGAGVIPYAFKDSRHSSRKSRAYILLGEELCYQDLSSRYSSFGGSFDKVFDITLDDVASREIFEETMGVFLKPTKKDPKPEFNRADGMKYFKNRFRKDHIVYNTKKGSQGMEGRGTYFVEVPYIKASKFNRVRKRLETRKIAEWCFLEKKAFVWIRAKRLLKLVEMISDPRAIQVTQTFLIKKSRQKKSDDAFVELSSVFVRGLCNNECRAILREIVH